MTTSQAALKTSSLAVELTGRRVLSDVHLEVKRGELVGLIGPNGAGKTTLLRTILGVQSTAAGHIRIEDRSPRPGRTPIGYVPQRHEFAWAYPLTVEQVVMTGLTGRLGLLRRPRREHWEAVADSLDRVHMIDLAKRPIGQLSGGQRQRVLVARALALQPSLLLLDEPFTGLDMPTQELLGKLFAAIAHEGKAVLMTTHDLLGAIDLTDRLVLLNRTVIAAGSPSELVADKESWKDTFRVSDSSPLLRMISAVHS